MARPYEGPASSEGENTPTSSASQRNRQGSETPPSPAPSTSSDKENRDKSRRPSVSGKRQTGGAALSPSTTASATSNKRRKMNDRRRALPTQASQSQAEGRRDKQFYDPDQDEDERRATKKLMRENEKDFHDNRADYLKASSDGITQTLRTADKLFRNVKQTSDATIDSRLLVGVADLSKKKVTELALGDSSIGVDVDEFISKCLAFMKKGADARAERGESPAPAGTQTQRRRRTRREDHDEEDTGEAPDWEYLAQNACFLHNCRPCVSGFLLGPLSVQKKVRQQTQRRAREARANPANALRPLEMREEDVEKLESANLTVICKEIRSLLDTVQTRGSKAFEDACEQDESINDDPERAQALLRDHGIADDTQVPLFQFCVNPKSFGQTVENLFYISFLIKEGSVGFNFDSRGLPTLGTADQKSLQQKQETPRNQAVFTLDFDTWEAIVESYGIKESIIPHREEVQYDDGTGEGRTGWYD